MPRTNEPGRTAGSRLLDVLFAFEGEHTAMTLAELTRVTGMPHATARRHVLELLSSGALERGEDGRLTVGLRLWRLGTLAPMTEPLRTLAKPFMEDLYTALRQHVQLAVWEGHEAVIIERLSAPQAVGLASQVGGTLPLHCSAVGKVLLSHAEPSVIESVLGGELRKYTERTVVHSGHLRREIAECRRTGVAVVRGELTVGADSIASRVMNAEGRVVAAISVVIGTGSVGHRAVLPSVMTSGLAISRALGWQSVARDL